MDIIILVVFFGLFFIIGLFTFRKSLKEVIRYKNCESWTKVNATVLSKEFKSETDSESQTAYGVEILYRYTYQSENYESTKICFGYAHSNFHDFHYRIYEKIKNAHQIEVWINPLNAHESVMVKAIDPANNVVSNFGLVFIVVACAMFIMFMVMRIPGDIDIIDKIEVLK